MKKKILLLFTAMQIFCMTVFSQNALNFSGSSNNVSVPTMNLVNQSFTIECWAQLSPSSQYLIFSSQGAASADLGLLFGFRSNTALQFSFYADDLNLTVAADNLWHHWAATYNAVTRLQSVYRDGVLIGSRTANGNYRGNGTFYIGSSSSGNLQEMRIWNRPLCVGEIQNNMNCQLSAAGQTGLLALYHFNQGTANGNNAAITTLTDASGNGNNGTLNSFTLTGSSSNWTTGTNNVTGTCSAYVPPTGPTVTTPIYYTQGATASALTATGTNLLWYTSATGGTGSSTAPTPSTATAGTFQYWVSQTNANGCESARTELDVIVTVPATALTFNGTNNYVTVPNINLANQSFTIECWAKRNVNGQYFWIGSQGAIATDGGLQIGFRTNNGFIFGFWNDDLNTTSTYTDFNWHHWAVTYNAVTKLQSIYEDGVLQASRTATGNYVGSGILNIGRQFGGGQFMNGSIQEMRIWNRALCEGEIQNNMNCALNPSGQNSLIALYHFNEGQANGNNSGITTLNDVSGNGNNGTLNNFTLTGFTSNWTIGTSSVGGTCTSFIPPTAPTVTPVVYYVQGSTANPLTASGTNQLWYTTATGGTGSATAPTPSTTNLGTTSYWVSQTVGGNCESARSEISVTITSADNITICSSQLPYSWNGNNYTATGTYTVQLTSSQGYDSAAELNLTVLATSSSL